MSGAGWWGQSLDDYDAKAARQAWENRYHVRTIHGTYLRRPRGWPKTNARWDWQSCRGRVWDHVYHMRMPAGCDGLLTMPYGFAEDSAQELNEWCEEYGGRWFITGDGWHYPGTIAVVVVPRDVHRAFRKPTEDESNIVQTYPLRVGEPKVW